MRGSEMIGIDLTYVGADSTLRQARTIGVPLIPGLVLVPAISFGSFTGGWDVVHVASGKSLCFHASTCFNCVVTAAAELEGHDWSRYLLPALVENGVSDAVARFSAVMDRCEGTSCDAV